MKDLVEFYRKMLGFRDCYAAIKQSYVAKKPNTIDQKEHKYFLNGYDGQVKAGSCSWIKNSPGFTRIDVPVWFGNPKSSVRVMVIGKEPKKSDPDFNLERINCKIFAAIFAADHWHPRCTLYHAKHLAYLHAFQSLLNKANQGKWFVLFTDLVKRCILPASKKKKTEEPAKQDETKKNKVDNNCLFQEIKLIAPTCIIALGDDVSKALDEMNICHEKVKHPSRWQNLSRIQIDEIVQEISNKKKATWRGK